MPLVADLHIDAALTDFAQEYASQNAIMIASKVAPVLPVAHQTDKYWVFGDEAFRLSVADRGAGGRYGIVDWTLSSDSYSCFGYGLSSVVPKELARNADPSIDPGQIAARVIVDQLMLAYEARVAAKAFATGTFTQTSALSSGDRWDTSTSDPVGDVAYAKAVVRGKIGVEPNTMTIGYAVFAALQSHADIRRIVYGLNAPESIPDESQIAKALGLDSINVGRATYRTAANTFGDVWGKYAFISYQAPNNDARSITPLRTFAWSVDGGRYATRGPVWDDDVKSWKYYVDDYTDEEVVSIYAAYLYSTVVS